jgi:hypothetical protein
MRIIYSLGRLASICLIALLPFSAGAQVSGYFFTELSGTYTPVSGSTVLGTATNDDTGFPALPIGFTFNYNGTNYTTFSAQSNGFIALGSTVSSSYTAISSGASNNVIAALNGDLQGNVGTGKLSYITEGTAPNQVLTVEWSSYRAYGATGDNLNFQIKLYETTNTIEVHYGTFVQNATSQTRQVGLRGASNADFNNRSTSPNWSTTIAGVANTATCALTTVVIPANGQIFRWLAPPPTPPTPFQDLATPSCLTGTTIDVVGTPGTDIEWYWQTVPNGTSMTDLYAGPFTVMENGTYYLRAHNTVTGQWSFSSSSIIISNFPSATTPPAPTADLNPSCVTTGSVLTAATPPADTEYYWQGTDALGTSTTLPATATYPVAATGTYYLAAYETISGCWSATSSLAVVVEAYIPPSPTAVPDAYFICTSGTTQQVTATVPSSSTVEYVLGASFTSDGVTATTVPFNVTALPAGATITSATVMLTNVNAIGGSYRSEIRVAISGAYTLAPTQISALTSSGLISPDPTINLVGFPVNGGAMNLLLTETFNDGGAAIDATFGEIKIVINYSLPVTTITWFDAPTAGTSLGTGSPFETVGTSVLPSPAPTGDYSFYAEAMAGTCVSATRTEVTVSASPVTIVLTPVSVTCNNGNDGTFAEGVPTCGTLPFTYSVDGGAFGPIPTNLTVGNHDVVAKDFFDQLSGTMVITVGDAPAPSALSVTNFTNDVVDLTWTLGGTEAQWNIEWGTPGFTPGIGDEIGSTVVSSTTASISGLDGFTNYDFYVSANCGVGTSAGSWVMVSQITLCDPFVAQAFCESFDSSSPTEDCWTVKNINGDADSWNMDNTTNTFSGDEGVSINTNGNGGANDDWLISPMLTLTNNEILNFHYRVQSAAEPNDFRVMLSTTGMDPADFTVELMALTSFSNITYLDSAIDLTAFSGDCYIAFHIPSAGFDGNVLYIDEVCVDICTPDLGTDGSTDACRLDNTLDLNSIITQGETNGVWEYLPNPGVVSGSDLNLGLLPDGTYQLEYIVTTACTTDTTLALVTVHPASSAGVGSTISDICTNWSSINLIDGLSGSIDLGGTWSNNSGQGDLVGSLWTPDLTTASGSYTFDYTVNNGFCPDATSTVTVDIIDCTGIDEANNLHLSVYPNPVVDVLTIQNVSIEIGVIEVLDVQGKVVSAVQVNGVYGNYALDMNNIQRGMYIVRITTETSVQEVRVVKH